MDFDLIQLIEDDDDELLQVAAPESAASLPDPVSSSLSSSSHPAASPSSPSSQPPPAPSPAAETDRPNVSTISQPPSYRESNQPHQPAGPVEGHLRSSLLSISVLFIGVCLISFTLNVVAVVYCSHFSVFGHGFWTPALVRYVATAL